MSPQLSRGGALIGGGAWTAVGSGAMAAAAHFAPGIGRSEGGASVEMGGAEKRVSAAVGGDGVACSADAPPTCKEIDSSEQPLPGEGFGTTSSAGGQSAASSNSTGTGIYKAVLSTSNSLEFSCSVGTCCHPLLEHFEGTIKSTFNINE